MCRLLVYSGATPEHPDPKLQPSKHVRGDVISVVEDGVFLGSDPEQGVHGIFRIIEIPGVPINDPRIAGLLHRDQLFGGGFRSDDGRTPHSRAAHLDLDQVEAFAQSQLKRSLATGEKIVVETSAAVERRIMKAIQRKLPVHGGLG